MRRKHRPTPHAKVAAPSPTQVLEQRLFTAHNTIAAQMLEIERLRLMLKSRADTTPKAIIAVRKVDVRSPTVYAGVGLVLPTGNNN